MPGQRMLDELNELHHDFLDLGRCIEGAVAESARALHEPHSDRVAPAAGGNDSLTERCHRIAERCQRIILLYQPVASDLRRVLAVLRMTAELERAGKLVIEIAERTVDLTALPALEPEQLSQLVASVAELIHLSLDAYEGCGPISTRRVSRTRAEVTELAAALTLELTGAMRADAVAVEPGLGLFAAVQNFQRIADHATNLAEEVVFLTEGSRLYFRADAPNPVMSEPTFASHEP